MFHLRFDARTALLGSVAVAMLLAGCSSSGSSTDAPSVTATEGNASVGQVVTKYEVISQLEPLTKAVVAYTDTDYTKSGGSPSSPVVLDEVESKYATIQTQENNWLNFTSGIDYSTSGISGLQAAVASYNAGLDTWQQHQEQGLSNWKKCVADGGGDLVVASCMLTGYSLEDEQEALTAYTTPLKALLSSLGVETQ